MSDENETTNFDVALAAASGETSLRKVHEVTVAGFVVGGESAQQFEDDPSWGLPDDAITPPISLDALSRLSTVNSTRRSIIEAIARNTVGLGVEAVPDPRLGSPKDDLSRKAGQLLKLLDALSARDTRMDSPSFTEHLFMVKTDEEECGVGGLEFSRNLATGKLDGCYYVPGKRLRRLRDRSGWVLLSPDGDKKKATYFVNFGERVELGDDGEFVQFRSEKTEILVFRLPNSESRDYGMPRDVAMVQDYYADKLAGEANIGFFDAGGVPSSIVFIGAEDKGGAKQVGGSVKVNIPGTTVKAIARTVKSDAGHAHRVALVPLPHNGKVEHVKLGQTGDKDIGYNTFRASVTSRQHAAFRLAPIFTADVSSGERYTAEVQRSITLEQVFDPEQTRYEQRLHRTLITDLGFENLVLKFKRLAVESDQARRSAAEAGAAVGAITYEEYREAHGYGPLPEVVEGDELADGRRVGKASTEQHDPQQPPVEGDPPQDAPPNESEIALDKVTAEQAALIGKVPAGWNKRLVANGKNLQARPSERRPASPDNRGQKDGIGGRDPSPEKSPQLTAVN